MKEKKDKKNKLEQELALARTDLSYDRTALSVFRTNLAFQNTRLSVEQTHLSFLRTIVSLIGSAATIYKGLPAIGVPYSFSTPLSLFLIAAAVYFGIKDRMTYPKLKKEIEQMEHQKEKMIQASRIAERVEEENENSVKIESIGRKDIL